MINNRNSFYLRRMVKRMLTHTYEHIRKKPILNGGNPTYDSWGNQIFSDESLGTKPCLLLWSSTPVTTEQGTTIVHTPVIYVEHDNILSIGDEIKNITDRGGNIIMARGIVRMIAPTAEYGSNAVSIVSIEAKT